MRLEVYFDGLCRVCSREIEHYRKRDVQGEVRWVDITDPSFSASEVGLDSEAIHRVMHVRDSRGEIYTGVGAFIEIWKVIPGFRPFARLASLKPLRPLLDFGYLIFARIRPYLPKKRRADCTDGNCSV